MSHLRWIILIVVLSVAFVAPQLGDRWLGAIERLAARLAARKWAAIVGVALAAVLARVALLGVFPVPVPVVHDEFSYLLAADTFVHGRLTNPPHPMWLFLDTFHVQQHPTYATIFPPAQGGALALGQVLGHPWIGVLLSTALMCAAITWMLQAWVPASWALLGGVLALLRFGLFTYWVNSYWGGAVALAGGAMVLGAFPRIIRRCRARDAVVLGVGAGLLANSRPVEGLLFCIPLTVVLVGWLFSRSSPAFTFVSRRVLFPLSCVMAVVLLFIGYYNWRVTGNALLFPHVLYLRQQCNCPVLPWQKQYPPVHYSNPQFQDYYNVRFRQRFIPSWDAWKHRSWRSAQACWQTFIGATLSIPFVTLPWVVRDRRMRLLLVQFCVSAVGLLLVIVFEPHYAAPMAATLMVLLVQAMRHLRQWHCFGRRVGIGLSRVVVLAVLANVPLYVAETIRQPPLAEAWNVSRARIIKHLEATPDSHLVIVRYTEHHTVDEEWVYNAADVDHSKVVWAREIPGQDLNPLLDYYRDRRIWLLDADAAPPQLKPYSSDATTRSSH